MESEVFRGVEKKSTIHGTASKDFDRSFCSAAAPGRG
jgi:hypothetical protein